MHNTVTVVLMGTHSNTGVFNTSAADFTDDDDDALSP